MARLGIILILDYTDSVIDPVLGHHPNLCVGVTIDVILQNGVKKNSVSVITP